MKHEVFTACCHLGIFYLFIHLLCQKTGLYKRTSLQTYSTVRINSPSLETAFSSKLYYRPHVHACNCLSERQGGAKITTIVNYVHKDTIGVKKGS